jgi:hypothetical protein
MIFFPLQGQNLLFTHRFFILYLCTVFHLFYHFNFKFHFVFCLSFFFCHIFLFCLFTVLMYFPHNDINQFPLPWGGGWFSNIYTPAWKLTISNSTWNSHGGTDNFGRLMAKKTSIRSMVIRRKKNLKLIDQYYRLKIFLWATLSVKLLKYLKDRSIPSV